MSSKIAVYFSKSYFLQNGFTHLVLFGKLNFNDSKHCPLGDPRDIQDYMDLIFKPKRLHSEVAISPKDIKMTDCGCFIQRLRKPLRGSFAISEI